MKNYRKYAKQYFLPKEVCRDWVARDALDEAPVWCSVDCLLYTSDAADE